jgi:formate dehydrogenase subunit gamma
MVETIQQSPDLVRFDRGERVLHWTNAVLFLTLLATGASLYVPALSAVVARRHLLKTIHVAAGLALPFPLMLTVVAGRWGAGFRADVRRLNRFMVDDRRWLRSWGRDKRARLGKFNAGQKLNAAFTAGSIPVMLGTGSIMAWPGMWPLSWRTGATFVHDWMFIGLAMTVTGHILFAINDTDSLASMFRGRISSRWAERHAPRWYDEFR